MEEDLPQKDRILFKKEYLNIIDTARRVGKTIPETNLVINSLILRLMGAREQYIEQIKAERSRYSFIQQSPQVVQLVVEPQPAQQLAKAAEEERKDERQILADQAFQVAVSQAEQQNAGSNPVTLRRPDAEDELAAQIDADVERARQRILEEEKIAAEQQKENLQRIIIEFGHIRNKYVAIEGQGKGSQALTTEMNKLFRGLAIKKQSSGKAITADNKAFILKTIQEVLDYAALRAKQQVAKITYQNLIDSQDVRFTQFIDFYIAYKLLKTMATNPFILTVKENLDKILMETYSKIVDESDPALRYFLSIIDNFMTNGYTKEGTVAKERRGEYKQFYSSLEKEPKRVIARSPTKPDLPNIK